MTFDVTTFGESMLRLSVPEGVRLQAAGQLDVYPAGAEANVVALLARLGRRCAWHSALPGNPLGRLVADHLRTAGVNLDGVLWRENGRMGTYYIEFAAPPRAAQVIYDRADSVVTQVTPDDLDWTRLLDTRQIHLTGITPALSPSCANVIQTIIQRAKTARIAVSFDVNYRAKLWTEREARDWLTPVIQGVDLLLCGQGDARRVFGLDGEPQAVAEGLAAMSGAKKVVVTIGDQGAIGWDGAQFHQQPALPVQVIDRIGAGDALAAGVIHGCLEDDMALGLRYGVALAALALSQYGDAVITTPDEIATLIERTNASGAVQR